MSQISNILDSKELNSYKIGLKLKNFDTLVKAIKTLTLISIGIITISLFWHWPKDFTVNDYILFLIFAILIFLVFSFPFAYLKSWQKMEEYSKFKNTYAFEKKQLTFKSFGILGIFSALIWGIYSSSLLYFFIFENERIRFQLLLLIPAAFIITVNQIIQIWFLLKAFSVLRKYKRSQNTI
jgi:hypothetical protein